MTGYGDREIDSSGGSSALEVQRESVVAGSTTPEGQRDFGTSSRYARFWAPSNERDAKRQIFTTDDERAWREGAKADFERIRGYFDARSTVLDLGCGIGRIAALVAPECAQLWAVDVSREMLEMAAERMRGRANIKYVLCLDTVFPDVPSASVDFAYSLLTLQHVEREDAFLLLEELRRVIKPAGVVVLTFPNLLHDFYLDSFREYAHRGAAEEGDRARIYTPQEVRRLVRAAGFIPRLKASHEIRVVAKPMLFDEGYWRELVSLELFVDRRAINPCAHRFVRKVPGARRAVRFLRAARTRRVS